MESAKYKESCRKKSLPFARRKMNYKIEVHLQCSLCME